MIDLGKLRVVYEVGKAGSFTAAGRTMNISQSSLSRTVINLEDQLGIKIFVRCPKKGIQFTPEGEKIFRFAARTIQEALVLEKLLKESDHEAQGELRISTTPGLGSIWLTKYLPGFIKTHPKIEIIVRGDLDKVDLVEADVAIRPLIPHRPDLIQRHLKSFPMRLFASPKYLEEYGVPETPEELDHHKLITFGDDRLHPYSNCDWIMKAGLKSDSVRRSTLQINSIEGLVTLANAGLGIVELPEEYMKLRQASLVEVLPMLEGPVVNIYYIYPERVKHSKRVSALADYLEATLAKESEGR